MAFGHWEGGLNLKITGSVVQSVVCLGARQGGEAGHIIFAPEPPHVHYSGKDKAVSERRRKGFAFHILFPVDMMGL